MEERLSFPDVIREAQLKDVFWRDFDNGFRWLYALVEDGKTIAGFEGTFYQTLAVNSTYIRHNSDNRLVPIESAPPLAHSQRKP